MKAFIKIFSLRRRWRRLIPFLVLFPYTLSGQWTRTNAPEGGWIASLAVRDSVLLAGSLDGIYHSSDNGGNWIAFSNNNLPAHYIAEALGVCAGTIFAGTGSGLFLSTNNGVRWAKWKPISYGELFFCKFAARDSTMFIGSQYGVLCATDYGKGGGWVAYDTFYIAQRVYCLAKSGDDILGGMEGGIEVWGRRDEWGFGCCSTSFSHRPIDHIAAQGRLILATTEEYNKGIYRSIDSGESWTAVPLNDSYTLVSTILIKNGAILVGTENTGIFRSTDDGAGWAAADSGLMDYEITSLSVIGNSVFAGTGNCGVFRSTDNGSHWTAVNTGLPKKPVNSLAVNGHRIFAGTDFGVFLSTDNGAHWAAINNGLAKVPPMSVYSLAAVDSTVFSCMTRGGVFSSIDNGANWIFADSVLADDFQCVAASGSSLFAGTLRHGVFRSVDNGRNWQSVCSGLTDTAITALAVSGGVIIAGSGHNGVFLSASNGALWSASNSGLANLNVMSLAVNANTVFAGTAGGGIFVSVNNGASWTQASGGLSDGTVKAFAVNGGDIFAVTQAGGVFVSRNNGGRWIQANDGLPSADSLTLRTLAANDSVLFTVTAGGDVWRRSIPEMIARFGSKPLPGNQKPRRFGMRAFVGKGSFLRVQFSIPASRRVIIQLVDIYGKEIVSHTDSRLAPGSYECRLDTRNLAPGCYLVKVQAGNDVLVKTIHFVH